MTQYIRPRGEEKPPRKNWLHHQGHKFVVLSAKFAVIEKYTRH